MLQTDRAVIAYNADRTPGLGSAIFLHINIGMPAGCVTLLAGGRVGLKWLMMASGTSMARDQLLMSQKFT